VIESTCARARTRAPSHAHRLTAAPHRPRLPEQWLDEKGYLEPIKSRLPTFTIPFTSIVFNGKGGVYGGGGSAAYKSVSSAGSGASATPMASSAYGST
jgi:hypothetical protein